MVSPVSSGCNLDISQCTAYFVSLKFDTEISPETKESDVGGESLPSAKLSSLEAPLPPKRLNHHNTLPLFSLKQPAFTFTRCYFTSPGPMLFLIKTSASRKVLKTNSRGTCYDCQHHDHDHVISTNVKGRHHLFLLIIIKIHLTLTLVARPSPSPL